MITLIVLIILANVVAIYGVYKLLSVKKSS